MIPLLTDPAAHGGDAAMRSPSSCRRCRANAVVRAHQPRKSLPEIGAIFDTLMTERLGYARYGAQGGDWGSFITAWLGATAPRALSGIHLNMMPLRRDASMFQPDRRGARYLGELETFC